MIENAFALETSRNRRYPAEMITDRDYADHLVPFAITPAQVILLLEYTAKGMCYIEISDKTEFMRLKEVGEISSLNNKSLKSVDYFTYIEI